MKVRYQSDEGGCFGEVNEVVLFPNELLEGKTIEEINQLIKNQISSFGCSGCVDYEKVENDVEHQRICRLDKKWNWYLLDSVQTKEEDHSL